MQDDRNAMPPFSNATSGDMLLRTILSPPNISRFYITRVARSPCVRAGIAIGGDVFPGSTLSDHCCRYQNIDAIKLIVVLGELGGQDEYSLVRAEKQYPLRSWHNHSGCGVLCSCFGALLCLRGIGPMLRQSAASLETATCSMHGCTLRSNRMGLLQSARRACLSCSYWQTLATSLRRRWRRSSRG